MWKFVAALGLLIGWSNLAWAFGPDAQACFRGTQQPAPDYLAYCTRAIEAGRLSRADLAMTHNNRGAILIALGRTDAALADFDRALALNPRLSLAYLSRGMIRFWREDYRGAWEDSSAAIESAPHDSRGYVNRSLVYIETEQHDAALQDLERALDINPEDPVAYSNRAVVYFRQGDHERAYADTENAIASGIDKFIQRGMVDHGLYMLRVSMNYARKRYEQVIADLDKVIRLRGDIAGVHNSRAWVLATAPRAELRDAQEALRSAKIAVKLADSPNHRETLAAAYAEAGAFEQAITEQQRAIAMLRRAGQTAIIPAYQEALDGYRDGQPRRIRENDG